MAIFKCKMCGGDLQVQDGACVVECGYCGTKQTVSATDDEKRINLYNRANHLRMNSEFDKAAGLYEQIVAEFPNDAEAYWGLCLCNYGIEYVDDPVTSAKIPTIHRASFEKMRKDENYERALENADATARIVYQEQAKEIDRIMGEVLAISRDEQPYDIFICYKETDEVGGRTVDSVIAQNIYDALTDKGYKVFFSRITLEDKLGAQYEPYIFAALNSSKVMLAVGTDYEYYNAVWVKNEWRRFWKLASADKSKVLIPCYKDMDVYDLPNEFKVLQAQDMGKVGAMQDLLRGIDKIFCRDKKAVAATAGSGSVVPLLERAFMFLEDGEWQKADDMCEQVLNQDPRNANAYLGKLMAEMQVKTPNGLKDCDVLFDENDNYKKAMRFGDEKLKSGLNACLKSIQEHKETERCEWKYSEAKSVAETAQSSKDFLVAIEMLKQIPGYKDANALADEYRRAYSEWSEREEAIRKEEAYQNGVRVMNNAGRMPNQYQNALRWFKVVPGYKNADELAAICQERIAQLEKESQEARAQYEKKSSELRYQEEKQEENAKKAKKFGRYLAVGACILLAIIVCMAFCQ